MGIPSVFVRLQACNILCKGEWTCDTIEVWKTGEKTSFEVLAEYLSQFNDKFKKGAHLIFTGGEPLIQRKNLKLFIDYYIDKYGFKPFIEVETNGTLDPEEFATYVDLFNCSFKLANSGVRHDRRIKIDVLKKLNKLNTIFKVVIGQNKDFEEALDIIKTVGIENQDVWLMPAADDLNMLHENQTLVADLCKLFSMNFSSRLQLVLWNKTTGV